MDSSRIRRKKSPFSKILGYVWTGPYSLTATDSLLSSPLIQVLTINFFFFYSKCYVLHVEDLREMDDTYFCVFTINTGKRKGFQLGICLTINPRLCEIGVG